MKILVTGATGQLGHDVVDVLTARAIECRGVGSQDFDLTDRQAVLSWIKNYNPAAVIHCAAYTAVDKAEEDKARCYAVNVDGAANVAEACSQLDVPIMYISTDYVFDGKGETAFEVDAVRSPTGYYGFTKSLGEDRIRSATAKHFIVRISWVFGINGKNFVRTMLALGKSREQISVVNDQVGSPTYTADLAPLLCDMIATAKYGTYHATNENTCSWFEFATAIMQEAELACVVLPITSSEYPTKAKRPKNSRLSKASLDKAGFKRLPTWQDALHRYITLLKTEDMI
jgi:dTDP-4-dehydrorhamnose reductase